MHQPFNHTANLESRDRKIVFLDYNACFKGRVILNLHCKELLISRNTSFEEHIILYHPLSTSPTTNQTFTQLITHWSQSYKFLDIYHKIVYLNHITILLNPYQYQIPTMILNLSLLIIILITHLSLLSQTL